MFLKIKNKKSGFTLIELLVVIAIIGILSSVVLSSLNTARVKARDAKRISEIKEMQKALELYYDDHGYYPIADTYSYYFLTVSVPANEQDGCGPNQRWCNLETVLSPYISKIPRDPLGVQTSYKFIYKYVYKNYKNGPDAYGLSTILESPNSASKNDGGYYDNWFEVGELPAYCKDKGQSWSIWNGAPYYACDTTN